MFVIFVLLTAYFQSLRMALISIGAVPGVAAGIVTILYVTGTTLNIESFMGAIMSWASRYRTRCCWWHSWMSIGKGSAVDRGRRRSAPKSDYGRSLMTACAMTVGMVPMALALEQGKRNAGPTRQGGDWRPGDVDNRYVARAAVDVCDRDR